MSDSITSTTHGLLDPETGTGLIGSLSPWTRYGLLFASPLIGWAAVFVLDSPFLFGCLWILLTLIGVGADRVNAELESHYHPNNNYSESIPAKDDQTGPENVEPDVGTQTEKKRPEQTEDDVSSSSEKGQMSIHHDADNLNIPEEVKDDTQQQQQINNILAADPIMDTNKFENLKDQAFEEEEEEEVEEATEAETTWIFPSKMSRLNSDQTNSTPHEQIEIIEMDSRTDSGMISIEKNFNSSKFQDQKNRNE